jgi:Rod binding domain-containing protein
MIISPITGAYSLGKTTPNPAAITKQAQDFEAMAISQMLKPMFDTVDAPDALFGGSPAEKTWQPFLLSAIAKQMEANGGLGLATQIEATLKAGATK